MKSKNSLIPLIFFLVVFIYSAEGICKPKNFAYVQPPSSSSSSSSSSSTQEKNQQSSPAQAPPKQEQQVQSPPPTPTQSSPDSAASSPKPSTPPSSPQRSSGLKFLTQPLIKTEPTSADPAIKKICGSTDYPDLCLNSLGPFLSLGKTDTVSVLESAIKALTQQAKAALAAATKLASEPGLEGRRASAVSDCQYMYNDSLDNIESALDALPSKDWGTVNSMLSAVITDSETCEDGFEGNSPLADFDDKLKRLGSNCLAISSLISPII